MRHTGRLIQRWINRVAANIVRGLSGTSRMYVLVVHGNDIYDALWTLEPNDIASVKKGATYTRRTIRNHSNSVSKIRRIFNRVSGHRMAAILSEDRHRVSKNGSSIRFKRSRQGTKVSGRHCVGCRLVALRRPEFQTSSHTNIL